jgi:BASS family bile acid:Na+ symporter
MTLDLAIQLLAIVALFELMFAIGLGVTLAELVGVTRQGGMLARALVANYVGYPLVAAGLLLLLRPWSVDPAHFPLVAAGFLIAAVCPGAPYGPPFTRLARGDGVLAVGLMVVLAGTSAFLAPLLLVLLLPWVAGETGVEIPFFKMAGTLLIAQFLPLCLGLAVRHRYPTRAVLLKKPADLLSLVLNLLLLGVILVVQFEMLVQIPLHAFLGMTVLVFAGVGIGWVLGGPGQESRTALALATAVRNVGVGLVIATTSFPGTKAVAAATAFALFQTILVALVALLWRRFVRIV